jgi:signal transduction histidine kinase
MSDRVPYRHRAVAAPSWTRALGHEARRLAARADHAARAGFQLATPELAGINRWLVHKSVVTCVFILAFIAVLTFAGGPPLPIGAIALLCAVAAAASVPFRAWLDSGVWLGLLVYAQFTLDVVLLTIGFAQLEMLPVLFHLQLLLVIIPCALLSRQCGIVMTALSIAAHLFLCWLRGSYSVAEVLGPIYFFAVVAHQCFFYGQRLAEKTQLAEHESRVMSALLAAADDLAAERSSTALLQRLTWLAKETTGGDWAAVTLAERPEMGHRIGALVTRRGFIDDEVLSVGLPATPDLEARIAAAGRDCIVVASPEDSLLSPELHERWRVGGYVAAVLRRAGEPLGLLIVGFDDTGRLTSSVSQRLVAGLARLGVLALDNARLVEDLTRASALKSEFIGTVSHELRSPLHAIIGYNDMLRDEATAEGGEGAARRDILERVHVHAHQLHEMIEATLNVSRLESGRVPLRVERLALHDVVREIAAEVPDFRRSAAVRLEWRVAADLPTIEADRGKLKTIARNLVDNALKFTDAGSVEVVVSLLPEGDRPAVRDGEPALLRLVVSDTGVGIVAEQRGAVFEMFRQGDGSLTRRHAGVGLGLYIVKRLVDVLRGKIELESQPGAGSTFTVTVPVTVRAAQR